MAGHIIGVTFAVIFLLLFGALCIAGVYQVVIGPLWHIGVKGRLHWTGPFDRRPSQSEDSAGL